MFLPAGLRDEITGTRDGHAQASAPGELSTGIEAAPVDLASLRQRCMGNRKIAAKALAKFDESLSRDIVALTENIQRGDASGAAGAAHKIKGAAANVSADCLSQIATEVEASARAGDLPQTATCVGRLRQEIEGFRQYLATALIELTAQP